jgi:hypothetical protein
VELNQAEAWSCRENLRSTIIGLKTLAKTLEKLSFKTSSMEAKEKFYESLDWSKSNSALAEETVKLKITEKLAGATKINFYATAKEIDCSVGYLTATAAKLGVKNLTDGRQKHPWNLMNFDLPNSTLFKIWKLKSGQDVANWRYKHKLQTSKFDRRIKIDRANPELKALIVAEQEKKDAWVKSDRKL